ncbi:MAG TPA: heterodisulfide reductase-related iron-sulfur binding cluster [Gemmatimonadaceae bacterium]|nr:heterodisulfide reductase-related iron-sulfur binding cluster [Gemmatimonadaceae bacterium]
MTAAGNPRTVHGAPDFCALPNTPLADAREGLDKCVHCGFCLQTCPTYVALEDENDSPRGRLLLMRSLLQGALETSDEAVRGHLDRCLGCRACETACPAGVPYGHLLEATRATITARHPLPLGARLLLGVFARPLLMRTAMMLGRIMRATRMGPVLATLLPKQLGFGLFMLEATRVPSPIARKPYATPVNGSRESFALLEGCVMEGLCAGTNRATERTLRVNGYRLVTATGQACCGALHAHAGDLHTARAMARRNIEAFEASGADRVVSNAAGCGAMLKEYGQLLEDDPEWAARAARLSERSRDVSELLADAGPVDGGNLHVSVTYDAPCHLLHAQRISAQPLKVLAAIPGAKLLPLTEAEYCCGAAGIYNLLEPDTSNAVLEPKLNHIDETAAALVATGNPGCLMQIGGALIQSGRSARAVHPVDLLDASYAVKYGQSTHLSANPNE